MTVVTAPERTRPLGDRIVALTEQIRDSRSGPELAHALAPLLDPDSGVLERVREALEAAGEHITDLDIEAHRLRNRFAIACAFVTASASEVTGWDEELLRSAAAPRRAVTQPTATHETRSTTPAPPPAAHTTATIRTTALPAPSTRRPSPPAHDSAPRAR